MMTLKTLLTGRDNSTQDLGRWSWAVTTLAVICGGGWNAIHTGAVDLTQFAQAIGLIVSAHGAALWAKRDTEPPTAP